MASVTSADSYATEAVHPPTALSVPEHLDGGAESQRGIALLAEATRALAAAESFDEIRGLRDKAEAVRAFARAANLNLDLQNKAAELKLRAERKAGAVLQKMKLRGGDRKSNRPRDGLKLVDMGLTENQSRRWQREALVPEEAFTCYVASAYKEGRELTAAGLLKLESQARSMQRAQRRHTTTLTNGLSTPKHSDACHVDEILKELQEHHHLLSSVLEPIVDAGITLAPHSRRVVRYLLGEIQKLIADLATQ